MKTIDVIRLLLYNTKGLWRRCQGLKLDIFQVRIENLTWHYAEKRADDEEHT
ncbi:hypothetical protein HMPREF1861_00683 [Corynebacterium kroppenstedtii]|nr:hypothetical protein HMPREF1861_00683 [Corynebacterium kroppenstedtii]